jgi:hypothetical protein
MGKIMQRRCANSVIPNFIDLYVVIPAIFGQKQIDVDVIQRL